MFPKGCEYHVQEKPQVSNKAYCNLICIFNSRENGDLAGPGWAIGTDRHSVLSVL
jgi:hypothetical protein